MIVFTPTNTLCSCSRFLAFHTSVLSTGSLVFHPGHSQTNLPRPGLGKDFQVEAPLFLLVWDTRAIYLPEGTLSSGI